MLLVVTAPVAVKQRRSCWHRAKQPCFAVVCGGHQQTQVPTPGCAPLPGRCSPAPFVPWRVSCRARGCSRGAAAAQSGASPAGSAGHSLRSPCPGTEGLCRSRGCHQSCRDRDAAVPSSSQRCCRLGSHPTGLCQEPELPSGQDHTSECQISHPRGLCSASFGFTVMSPSWP